MSINSEPACDMSPYPNEAIVRTGTFVYADDVECELRVVRSAIRYGSGDEEDPPQIANDEVVDTFYVQYGAPAEPGVFNSGSQAFPSLQAAMEGAANQLGPQRAICWHAAAAGEA